MRTVRIESSLLVKIYLRLVLFSPIKAPIPLLSKTSLSTSERFQFTVDSISFSCIACRVIWKLVLKKWLGFWWWPTFWTSNRDWITSWFLDTSYKKCHLRENFQLHTFQTARFFIHQPQTQQKLLSKPLKFPNLSREMQDSNLDIFLNKSPRFWWRHT